MAELRNSEYSAPFSLQTSLALVCSHPANIKQSPWILSQPAGQFPPGAGLVQRPEKSRGSVGSALTSTSRAGRKGSNIATEEVKIFGFKKQKIYLSNDDLC